MQPKQIVSHDEWLAARRDLLAKEKAHMRAGDTLAAERRSLPWVKIEKSYEFDTAGGRRSLVELFDGSGQLIVHHLMFAPEWEAACPGCSFQAEHIDGPAQHLEHHNVIGVEISGQLWAQPVPLELLVRTEIDLETGQVEIADLAPSRVA